MASYQYTFVIEQLSKSWPGGKELFSNINLSFLPNAKIGIVGVNGAGKSTFLKIMAGIEKDYTGEAWAADGISLGYLPQEPVLDEDLKDEIFKISDVQNINFSLYDLDGTLIGSTVDDNVTTKLDELLINDLGSSTSSKLVKKNESENQLIRSSFSYILDIYGKPIWILNLPYVDDDKLNAYEIRSFIINIAQVYILLFVLAIIISYFVSLYITNPISELRGIDL